MVQRKKKTPQKAKHSVAPKIPTGFSLGFRAGLHRACADYKWMFLLGVLALYCLLAALHLLLAPTVLYA